jgi:BirA family biotin operon repressor/biotin-[acetyl-CoA-carboxylase] ligase
MEQDSGLEPLRSELEAGLQTAWLGRRLHLHGSMPSTQDEAARLAAGGAPHGTVVWAREQTAGRGRIDRSWVSPPDAGVWFTAVLRPELAPAAAARIGIVAGVAVADALIDSYRTDIQLKWPNDVRREGRKVGGILCEASVDGERLRHVLLGVGVNLVEPEGGFHDDIAGAATTASEYPERSSLGATTAILLNQIEKRYEEFVDAGLGPSRERWIELSDTLGTRVRAQTAEGVVEGTAVDLGPDGSLIVMVGGGELVSVGAGEIVHLR